MLTEHELTQVLQMLDAIQDKMGIANDEDSELADLEKETKPEDVLAEIERLELRALLGKKAYGESQPQRTVDEPGVTAERFVVSFCVTQDC